MNSFIPSPHPVWRYGLLQVPYVVECRLGRAGSSSTVKPGAGRGDPKASRDLLWGSRIKLQI